jgi:hypothetical protein
MCGPTFHRRDTQVAVTCSGIRVQDKPGVYRNSCRYGMRRFNMMNCQPTQKNWNAILCITLAGGRCCRDPCFYLET